MSLTKTALLLPVLLLCAWRCGAQEILFTGAEKSLLIGDKTELLYDTAGRMRAADVAASTRWQPSTHQVLNIPHSPGAYWLRFSLRNESGSALLLEAGQPLLGPASLYTVDSAAGLRQIEPVMGGSGKVHHHHQVFSLPGNDHTFYLRFVSRGLPLPLRVWSRDVYEQKIGEQKVVYGMYIGILLFVVLNNLFLFFSLRKRAYLHYTLLVSLYAIFSIIYEGYFPYFFPGSDPFKWYILNPIVNQPNGLLYCILFLDVKKYLPRLYKVAIGFLIYFTSYIFWHFLLPESTVLILNQFHALVGILLMATLGVRAGAKGNRLGYYFSLAYFIFFAIAVVEVLYDQTGRPPYVLDISHISIGILIEVFILTYLLSKRFEWEKEDMEHARSEAQRGLLEETQKNEQLVREQNVVLDKAVTERTAQLQAEKQKSDDLLLNILPAEVAEELKQSGDSHARLYERVTVLFTDFVSFTRTAERMSSQELVAELHACFTAFDEITDRHGVEKIKTVGDAYLAVAGMPTPDARHAQQAIAAALEIRDFMAQRKAALGDATFAVRIGVNSGPVIAGIVGVKKFAYDIWGDTVNTAARMEQHGEAGRVNISGATYALVKEDYHFISRGKVAVKDKGEVEMYFVEGLMAADAILPEGV